MPWLLLEGTRMRHGQASQLTGAEDRATLDNPLGTSLSPMSPVQFVTHVSGLD